jgi:hypothetical protein
MGGTAVRSVGAEVDTPEIAFVGVDVTGAASPNWVLDAPGALSAEDASALEASSRAPSSLEDDATSVLDVLLSSADLLSSPVALAVRTVSVTDSLPSLSPWMAGVSAVPASVAAVAVLRASLLTESLLLAVRVLDVAEDVASPAEPCVLDVSRATVFSAADAVSVVDVLVVASLARSLRVVVAAPEVFVTVEVAFVRDVCSPERVDRVVFAATCVAVDRAGETVSLLDALVVRAVEATASLEVRPVFSASVTASLLDVLTVRVAVSVAARRVSCPLRVNSLVVLAACVTASWAEAAFLLSSLAVRVAAAPASLLDVLIVCAVCVAV